MLHLACLASMGCFVSICSSSEIPLSLGLSGRDQEHLSRLGIERFYPSGQRSSAWPDEMRIRSTRSICSRLSGDSRLTKTALGSLSDGLNRMILPPGDVRRKNCHPSHSSRAGVSGV